MSPMNSTSPGTHGASGRAVADQPLGWLTAMNVRIRLHVAAARRAARPAARAGTARGPRRWSAGVASGGAGHRGVDGGDVAQPAVDGSYPCAMSRPVGVAPGAGSDVWRRRSRSITRSRITARHGLPVACSSTGRAGCSSRWSTRSAHRRSDSRKRSRAVEQFAHRPGRLGLASTSRRSPGRVLAEPAGVIEQHPHGIRSASGKRATTRGGQHRGQRVVERDLALLHQLQRRGGDERLHDAPARGHDLQRACGGPTRRRLCPRRADHVRCRPAG